jgi:hypothetical protein
MAMKRGDRPAARSHALKWVRSNPLLLLRGDLLSVTRALLPNWLAKLMARREARKWSSRLRGARKELCGLLPRGVTLILVDENQWGRELSAAHPTLPFLEREGQYWGPPPDDATAIRELDRLRRAGASFIAFAWPAFWWLDHYADFHEYLRSNFRCLLRNDRLVVFDLRPAGPGSAVA